MRPKNETPALKDLKALPVTDRIRVFEVEVGKTVKLFYIVDGNGVISKINYYGNFTASLSTKDQSNDQTTKFVKLIQV